AGAGPSVVATGRPSVDTGVRPVASPVFEDLAKPFRPKQLQALLRRIARRHWPGLGGDRAADELAGGSVAMRRLADTVMRMASSDAPVLLAGEAGSGRRARSEERRV